MFSRIVRFIAVVAVPVAFVVLETAPRTRI